MQILFPDQYYYCILHYIYYIMLFRFRRTRKPIALVPLLPFGFIVTYLGDAAYGNKMERIRGEHDGCVTGVTMGDRGGTMGVRGGTMGDRGGTVGV